MKSSWQRTAASMLAAAMVVMGINVARAQNPQDKTPAATPAVELNDQEKAFVDLMKDSTLVGHFSVDGAGEDGPAKTDRYRINGVSKMKDDNWLVHARIVYGDFDVVVPVPVKMHWAGDTAVLSVTNLSLPALGQGFSSRLLFDGQRYAGTWAHNEVGGHMWGKIEKQSPEEKAKPATK